MLETPILGALTRGSRVATNVYQVLKAARGKQMLFFPARFDAHKVQAVHGYAYSMAVQLFNQTSGKSQSAVVSTEEQAAWWGGRAAARWPTPPSPASWATRPSHHGLRGYAPPRHPAHRAGGLPQRLRGHSLPVMDAVPALPRADDGRAGGGGPATGSTPAARHSVQPARRVRAPAWRRPAGLRGEPAPGVPDARGHRPRLAGVGRSRAEERDAWPTAVLPVT